MENFGFKSESDSTSHDSYASSSDVVVVVPETKRKKSHKVFKPSETLPSTSEITLKTAYRTISSDVNRDSGSGTDSHDECMSIPDKQPMDTVQPYAVSHIVAINQSAIESAYHNPYISFHSDDESSQRSGADGSGYQDVQPSDTMCPGSPKSELSRSHSTKSKVSSPGIYTRQLNMFIGEEWENVQQRWTTERKALSCPGTLRVPTVSTSYKNSPDNLRRLEILQRRQQQATHDPLRYYFYQMTREERDSPIIKDHVVKPNPYNNINHKIHSALHCPCFFFFYLLCCFPGVHYMQKGDIEYKREHDELARKYSRRATILYLTGAILGTLLLATTVYLAVNFVQTQVK